MFMKIQGLSEQKRELPWPALKIRSLKSKQFSSLGSGRGNRKNKDGKMKVYPTILLKTKDGENLRQVHPTMLLKTR